MNLKKSIRIILKNNYLGANTNTLLNCMLKLCRPVARRTLLQEVSHKACSTLLSTYFRKLAPARIQYCRYIHHRKDIGRKSLAAVGSSYTLMVFITSIFIGLCMGCSALFSMRYGAKDYESLRRTQAASLLITGSSTLIIFAFSCYYIQDIITLMQTPQELQDMTYDYLKIIFMGIWFVYLYNYYAYLLRALGNSLTPLIYLAISVVLNIMLDIWFIVKLHYGIEGAAAATIISQAVSAIGLCFYCWKKGSRNQTLQKGFQGQQAAHETSLLIRLTDLRTASVMNFGILMVQGLVNSFGTAVMAAFTAAVRLIRSPICLYKISGTPSLLSLHKTTEPAKMPAF